MGTRQSWQSGMTSDLVGGAPPSAEARPAGKKSGRCGEAMAAGVGQRLWRMKSVETVLARGRCSVRDIFAWLGLVTRYRNDGALMRLARLWVS